MKKRLSLFLAVVMMITMLPAMGVFAATKNSVSFRANVKKDFNYWDDTATPPILTIDPEDVDLATDATFRLSLDNADFGYVYEGTVDAAKNSGKYYNDPSGKILTSKTVTGITAHTIERISDNEVLVTIKALVDEAAGEKFQMPLLIDFTDNGPVRVKIESWNSSITPDEILVGSVAAGNTTARIASVKTFADSVKLDTLVIDENSAKVIKSDASPAQTTLRLKLNSGFEFVSKRITFAGIGGLNLGAPTPVDGTYGTYGERNYEDRSILDLKIPQITPGSSAGTMTLSGLEIIATKDAKQGDVTINISGSAAGITSETINVAKYTDYDLSLTAEDKDLPELVNGIYPSDETDSKIETLKVILKENTANSWNATRKTEFIFPDGVKPRAVDIVSVKNITPDSGEYANKTLYNTKGKADATTDGRIKITDDGLELRSIAKDSTKKAELELRFYLSVEPGYEGDIDVTATGAAVSQDVSATIATAVNPFTVDTTSTSYGLGMKELAVGDITIKETKAGSIQRSGENVYSSGADEKSSTDLVVAIEDIAIMRDSASVDVTEGDIVVEKIFYRGSRIAATSNNNNTALYITVKSESSKPSTLVIKDTKVSLDRTLPTGNYELRIGGIVCANYSSESKLEYATFPTEYYVAAKDYVVITTPPVDQPVTPGTIAKKVSITIGETKLTSDEEEITMDVAAFIQNNATYIPLSAVAFALGIPAQDVVWNPTDKTVMITVNGKVCVLKANSNVITVNGTSFTISAPVIIKDNRVMVPLRVLGELILGVNVGWDEATRTATFN